MNKKTRLGLSVGLAACLLLVFFSITYAASFGVSKQATAEQLDTPWYDPAWNYRRSVVITNSGGSLLYYQVLVKLDNSNFNFNLAKPDGSDIRFTHSDGTTELQYWIESWNSTNHLAFIWVRVPGLAAGITTIYIYYNNPQAVSASNGKTTFDGFDDVWSQFLNEMLNLQKDSYNYFPVTSVESPFMWNVIGTTPTVTSGVVNLVENSGIKTTASYKYDLIGIALGMRANFGLGAGREWGGFINGANGKNVMIGDLPSDPDDLYLRNYRDNAEDILIPRFNGNDWHNAFHIYEIRWEETQTKVDVDHGISGAVSTLPSQVPNIDLPVTLYSFTGSNASLKVDWVYLRQYRTAEPTSSLGTEQGLVELEISALDSPDPLPKNAELTYLITVTNSSLIDAPGVVLTDTLPGSVQPFTVNPSQGVCSGTNVITCNLGSINAHASAGVTIIGKPQSDGVITDTVQVDSPGFELDRSDNLAEVRTLIDSVVPMVNWEVPVQNGGTYYKYDGGSVTLEASATDNDQVAWVEFKFWDHNASHWVIIGRDYTYPYRIQFDTSIFEPFQAYQTFVYAADRAGNQSDPYSPVQRIFLGQRIKTKLPMISK
jgi:Domain of unknown function (DUF2341)/Domain of unknown function DUF11/Bacterial Ig domain